jgi:hypothetical protein
MRHFFHFVPALLAIIFGCVLLLPLLARASIHDPSLQGPDYWAAVLGFFLRSRVALAAFTGIGIIVLGLAQILEGVLLSEADGGEMRQILPAFWIALGIGTVGFLLLLVGVNYLGLQAGEIIPISRMIYM